MPQFIDARTVPDGTQLSPDLAIIGGGPAGISLALALANAPVKVLLIESGGREFDPDTQSLYSGQETGVPYIPLDATRLRYLGGSTNHWGGWCRPLAPSDFEVRPWVKHSGWPFGRSALEPYFDRAQALVEAGPYLYDDLAAYAAKIGPLLPLGEGGVYTSFFQFSQQAGNPDHLPTHFGDRYGGQLRATANLTVLLHANVMNLGLSANAAQVERLDVATLSGRRFSIRPRVTALAAGAIETARLLLASNGVSAAGVGNQNDLVGRFFADHAIPRNTATLVAFAGGVPEYYVNNFIAKDETGPHFRATFAASERFKRDAHVLGSLATLEQLADLDELGRAAVVATSSILGVDASNAQAFALGCGFELMPDPERRLTLTGERDALGMPRLKLHMTFSDGDYLSYRRTLAELGRQLLAARTGMIRLDRTGRDEWLAVLDWGNHHMGTARMHTDPKQGVVDADCKVHGIANLFVAGSAVFPTYGASNPTMNLVALCLRLADHLKGVLR